jgi:UDP-glucose 4-epimerase
MKVLITGGAGFIGSHIAEQLQGRAEVRVLDNFRTGRRQNLDGLGAECLEGSILDRDAVRAAMRGIDCVLHLAALVSVPESVAQPEECFAINVTGLLNVLEAAAAAGVRKFCFSSSAAVYGDNPAVPKLEAMPPEPRSPYASTKLEGEHYCQQFAESGRLETVALRFFNVFGPRQNPDSAYAAAVPIFIRQALTNQPLTIHGDGIQTRDFIYVKDIAAACIFAATTLELSGVFNAGYGNQITVLDLARRIIALTGSRSEIRHSSERPGDVRHSVANVEALRRAGFQPAGTLEAGLAETIAHFRSSTPPGPTPPTSPPRLPKRTTS